MRLNNRVAALEAKRADNQRGTWVRILCHEGETPEAAIAEHEKRHGLLGPDDNAIIRVIVRKPFPRSQCEENNYATIAAA